MMTKGTLRFAYVQFLLYCISWTFYTHVSNRKKISAEADGRWWLYWLLNIQLKSKKTGIVCLIFNRNCLSWTNRNKLSLAHYYNSGCSACSVSILQIDFIEYGRSSLNTLKINLSKYLYQGSVSISNSVRGSKALTAPRNK